MLIKAPAILLQFKIIVFYSIAFELYSCDAKLDLLHIHLGLVYGPFLHLSICFVCNMSKLSRIVFIVWSNVMYASRASNI